ncbi:MAG: hypothetical protein KTR20_06050 [Cellvibrionaceae bacterium]|nr:hypothetical protein [Cellvibrionaceae bacterium]
MNLVTLIISALLGFASSFIYFTPKLNAVNEQLQLSPPVLIVDSIALAARAVPVGSPSEAIDEHYRNVGELVNKFRDGGFLVLDIQSVLDAPEELFLTVDDLPPNSHLNGLDGLDKGAR